MVKYGLNRVQLSLWLKQSLINGFFLVWFVLGHSGQRTSVKCAEAAWNNKVGGKVHLKSPAFFFPNTPETRIFPSAEMHPKTRM